MADRVKGKLTTLLVTEDGTLQTGSWAKVEDWSLKPLAEVTETRFCGDPEAEFQLDHWGWEFAGTFQESGPEIRRLYLRQVQAVRSRTPPPVITITAITNYLDGVTPPLIQNLGGVVLKLDDFSAAGGEFVKNKIAGKCKRADELAGTA